MGCDTAYRFGRSAFRTFREGLEKEWVLTNGIGGFANSTIIGASNRVFSGYLTASLHPPVDRMLILAKTQEEIEYKGEVHDLAAQEYPGQVREGQRYLNQFTLDILPTYTYQVGDIVIKKTIAMKHGENAATVCYEVIGGRERASFHVTPLFTYRPFGSVISSKEELAFERNLQQKEGKKGGLLTLIPPKDKSVMIEFFASDGEFYDRTLKPTSMATPNYLIDENEVFYMDQRTGFTGVDHMATPYDIRVFIEPFSVTKFYVNCTLTANLSDTLSIRDKAAYQGKTHADSFDGFEIAKEYKQRILSLMEQIPYPDPLAKRLAWAADAFIVHRESTGLKTILAGLPWFADWGRDTMIALQGLTMATGRLKDARDVLESFSRYVKNGMIPNVFPNSAADDPGYNTIDASLWYFYSVDKYLSYDTSKEGELFIKNTIYPCLTEIIEYYKKGTAYGIHMDEDGLIMGGSDLDQLTWMDVRVGEIVVTPRHGKPVEINALWYNALKVMEKLSMKFLPEKEREKQAEAYAELAKKVKKSFKKKFWNEEKECLYDVITVISERTKGKSKTEKEGKKHEIPDDRIRPNQIYAVSLPYTMLSKEKEKKIVQTVYEKLYTPYGLRSLDPQDTEYKKEYYGKLIKRDMAYHMGTAWGYLSGAFITAFCKVGEYSKETIERAKEMCKCFEDHMMDGCINGIAEIFDGDFTCTSRGCYTQAWSVGEVLRAYTEDVLAHENV